MTINHLRRARLVPCTVIAILVASGVSCGRGGISAGPPTAPSVVGNSCGLASIDRLDAGSLWIRGEDDSSIRHQCAGSGAQLIIRWDGVQGLVSQASAACTFKAGLTKWRNLNRAECTFEDLVLAVGSTANPSYTKVPLVFNADASAFSSDGVTYRRCGTPGAGC